MQFRKGGAHLGPLTNVIDSAGQSVTNCYNNQGLLCTVNNAYGCMRMTTYDIEDHAVEVVDANCVTNKFTFDDLGRMIKRTDGNGSIETFGYSALGLVAYTNQLTNVTYYGYDTAGRKTAETNANGEAILYTYDAAGNLAKLKDGKGQETTWGYDQYGRVTSKTNAAGTEILRYQYDANGRLTNRWSVAKGNTRYVYDAAGNLTLIDYPSSADITMQYDANNRLTNMVDAVGTTRLNYTDWGALLSEDGPWDDDTVSYNYTSNRLRSALSFVQPNASPWQQTYSYDAAGRLTSLTSPAGAFSYLYDPNYHLQVAKLSQPNGAYITNTFDVMARITGTYLKNSAGTTLNSHEYVYDAGSRRTRQTRTDGSLADYGYDKIGQLKTAIGKENGGTTNRAHEQFGYAYDAAWNLNYRTNGSLVQTFNVNNLNELTTNSRSGKYTVAGTTWGPATNVTVADNGNSPVVALRYADATFARTNITLLDGTNTFTAVAQDSYGRADTNTVTAYLPASVTFVYDGNGNLCTNGTRVFEYDDENQLIRITDPNSWKSELTYDGKMRRRIRKEYTWRSAITNWVSTLEVHYVYDGNLVLQERHFAPQLSTTIPQQAVTYTRGRDLSGILEGAGGIGGLLARTDGSLLALGDPSAHAYYHADGNGNVTTLTDAKQLLAARYLYDPYGNLLSTAGPLAEPNLYRFSSKELHPSSGLVYYLYRHYDPSVQRWINRDPIQERGGINVHAFAANSPSSKMDDRGLQVTAGVPPPCGSSLGILTPPPAAPPGAFCLMAFDCTLASITVVSFPMKNCPKGKAITIGYACTPRTTAATLLFGCPAGMAAPPATTLFYYVCCPGQAPPVYPSEISRYVWMTAGGAVAGSCLYY